MHLNIKLLKIIITEEREIKIKFYRYYWSKNYKNKKNNKMRLI